MNKEEIYQILKKHDIKFEVNEHKAIFNMDELNSVELS